MSTGSGGAFRYPDGRPNTYAAWNASSHTSTPSSSSPSLNAPSQNMRPSLTSSAPGSVSFDSLMTSHPASSSQPAHQSALGPSPIPSSLTNSSPALLGREPTTSKDGIPDPPTRFPELESMSMTDLRTLNEERAKFDDFVSKHKYQRTVDEIVEGLRREVEQYERENQIVAGKSGQMEINDSQIEDLRQQVEQLQKEVDGLQSRRDEWEQRNSPPRLIERLRVSIRELESVCETLEKDMLSSGMKFDDFITQYMDTRKKYHELSLKLEQLKIESRRSAKVSR